MESRLLFISFSDLDPIESLDYVYLSKLFSFPDLYEGFLNKRKQVSIFLSKGV